MKAEKRRELLARYEPAWGQQLQPETARFGSDRAAHLECSTCHCSLASTTSFFFADRRYCEAHRMWAELPTETLKRSLEARARDARCPKRREVEDPREYAPAGVVTPPGSTPDMTYRTLPARPARGDAEACRLRSLISAFVVVDACAMEEEDFVAPPPIALL